MIFDFRLKTRSGMAEVGQEFGKGHEAEVAFLASVEHFVGEEGGGFVGRGAAVFLQPLFLVDALGADAR